MMVYKFLCFSCLVLSLEGFSAYVPSDFKVETELVQNDTSWVNELLEEAHQANTVGDYAHAKDLIFQADSLSKALDYSGGEERAMMYLADVHINEGNYEHAIELMNEAVNSYPESIERAQFHNLLGSAYNYISETNKAIQNFEAALEFTDRLPSQKGDRMSVGLLQNLAVAYQSLGQNNKAFENYLTATEYAEVAKDTVLLTITYNNLGQSYNSLSEYEEAIYYYKKSLEYAEAQNAKIDIYRARLNMANTLSNMEHFEEALENYEIAERLYKELRPNSPPVIILHNRGKTLASMGEYEEGEALLKESLELSENLGIRQGMYYNYHVLGSVYLEQERSEESIFHLETAVDLAVESTNANLIRESREMLYKAYAQANRFEDAFATLRIHKAFSDSLTDLEKEKELASLKNQLELNRQNEVNRLLQEKQEEQESKLQFQLVLIIAAAFIIILIVVILFIMRKTGREKEDMLLQVREQKKELEELNRTKDELFAIIAHDLRTPLSSMQGVLYLIKEKALSEEDMNRVIQELEISVQKNVDVMEDLLVWAKKQLSGVNMQFGSVSLQPMVQDIISSQKILADKKGISIVQNIEEDETVKADSNALQLVLRNLISNAIKYTKEGDDIEIGAKEEGEKVVIYIKDTGLGIPEKAFEKIFETKSWTRDGTNKEKGSGFGLSLSKEFVERMYGKIWFESQEGVGTTFFIELPKNG